MAVVGAWRAGVAHLLGVQVGEEEIEKGPVDLFPAERQNKEVLAGYRAPGKVGGSRRGVAQPGSALAWGASGRGFKSRRPDQNNNE